MTDPVVRVTLFKIPREEDQKQLLDMYHAMPTKAFKDGKPYIVECNAGRLYDDSRNQGFTVSAVSKFASMRDFEFYDKECKAHQELRAFAQSVAEGYCMSYYHPIKLAEPKI